MLYKIDAIYRDNTLLGDKLVLALDMTWDIKENKNLG